MNLRALVYGMIVGLFVAAILYFFVLEKPETTSEQSRAHSGDTFETVRAVFTAAPSLRG